ncbi:MAG: SDR family oxidoreductase [Actinomycetota bacterium]|nr:SDR family oxidoreductase [Actinomycetota bacterium]
MDLRLDGKVALITGSSRGIGLATAQALARSGAAVMLSSRKAGALAEAAATMDGEVAWHVANAGDPDTAAACVDATLARFGRLDILVNNAATNPYYGPTIDIDASRAAKTASVNQIAPIFWSNLAWHRSMAEQGGVIVNVASVGGYSIEANIGFYNATKAALIHLTRQLASELGPKVRVNAVAPGLVKTDMAAALVETYGAQLAGRLPLRRLGEPADVANAVVFLASDRASWITGQTLVIDGGSMVAGGLH